MKLIESQAKFNLEKRHMKNKSSSVYLALEHAPIDWKWNPKEVGWFDDMWKEGHSVPYIAEQLGRPPMDVFMLSLDRIYKNKIYKRRGGFWGV